MKCLIRINSLEVFLCRSDLHSPGGGGTHGQGLRLWAVNPSVGKAHPNHCRHTVPARAQPGAALPQPRAHCCPSPGGSLLGHPGSSGLAKREQWQPCSHLSTYLNPTFSQALQDPKATPKWPHAQHLPTCSFWAQNKGTLSLPASTGKGSSPFALNICALCHILPELGQSRSLCALNREPTFTETCDLSPLVSHCSSCNTARRSCSCLLWVL